MSVSQEWVIQPKELSLTALCQLDGGRPFTATTYSPIELTETQLRVLQAKAIEVSDITPLDMKEKPKMKSGKAKKDEVKFSFDTRRVCKASVAKADMLYEIKGDTVTFTDKDGKNPTKFLRVN